MLLRNLEIFPVETLQLISRKFAPIRLLRQRKAPNLHGKFWYRRNTTQISYCSQGATQTRAVSILCIYFRRTHVLLPTPPMDFTALVRVAASQG
jgi:hypothetical protein